MGASPGSRARGGMETREGGAHPGMDVERAARVVVDVTTAIFQYNAQFVEKNGTNCFAESLA